MSAGPVSWTFTPPARSTRPRRLGDRWLAVLGVVLVGYALFGRGFAYLGVPPLFIGEIVLATGLVVVLTAIRLPRLLPTIPMKLLAVLMLWVVLRTVPYLGSCGLDAVRDAMLAGYAVFAILVAALLLDRPERLVEAFRRYRVLAVGVLAVGWWLYIVYRIRPDLFPAWPWADGVAVVANKPGDLLVHLAGITAFFVLGMRRASPLTLALLVVATGALMIGNRGGMVGYLLGVSALAVLKPARASFGRLGFAGLFVVVLAFAVDTGGLAINEGNRSLAPEQLVENIKSVFGLSDERHLNSTAEWRTQWWGEIVDYTFAGPYFADGKGFGVNLATADGFQVDERESLRSPHNSHLTFLARGGVPAFVLWLLVQGLWAGYVAAAWWRARLAGQEGWMSVFAFLTVYWVAAHVNASFDVYLEGPMGAILFWSVYGAGIAATVLQRTHPHLVDDLVHLGDRAAPEASLPEAGTAVRVAPRRAPATTWGAAPTA
ncbi:MAG: O-antigen ligase family protein [Bacteroidota bacterium]